MFQFIQNFGNAVEITDKNFWNLCIIIIVYQYSIFVSIIADQFVILNYNYDFSHKTFALSK